MEDSESKTLNEIVEDNPEIAQRITSDQAGAYKAIGEKRLDQRRRSFASQIAVGDIDKSEIIALVKEFEDKVIEKMQQEGNIDEIPVWVARAKAQTIAFDEYLTKLKSELDLEE